MINRKSKIIKKVYKSSVTDVFLLIVLLLIIIGTSVQAFVVGGGIKGVYNLFVKNPRHIFVFIIVILMVVDIIRKIILSIQHTMNVVEFFDNHPLYNERVADLEINRYIEIIDEYIIITSRIPYIINLDKSRRFVITKKMHKLFFSHYALEFMENDGGYISVFLPEISEKNGSLDKLVSYLNDINKYDV